MKIKDAKGSEGKLTTENLEMFEEIVEEEEFVSFPKECDVEIVALSGSDEEIAAAAWTSSTLEITQERLSLIHI